MHTPADGTEPGDSVDKHEILRPKRANKYKGQNQPEQHDRER